MTENSPFSEQLRYFRERAGFTQEQLAPQIGVVTRTVSRWETGQITPKVRELQALAEILGCVVLVDNQGPMLVEPGSPTGRAWDAQRAHERERVRKAMKK